MNKYLVRYKGSLNPDWIPFMMLANGIYEVVEWVKENVTRRGWVIDTVDDPHEPWGPKTSDVW